MPSTQSAVIISGAASRSPTPESPKLQIDFKCNHLKPVLLHSTSHPEQRSSSHIAMQEVWVRPHTFQALSLGFPGRLFWGNLGLATPLAPSGITHAGHFRLHLPERTLQRGVGSPKGVVTSVCMRNGPGSHNQVVQGHIQSGALGEGCQQSSIIRPNDVYRVLVQGEV